MNDHLLEIDSVELWYGERPVLQGVYLQIATGRVTGLLGRNGCGKSSLMKVLCGALTPRFKSMRIDGVWHERFSYREVRYLLQESFIPPGLTVRQVLRDFRLAEQELTTLFPLFVGRMGAKMRELSGGEQRLLECYAVLRSDAMFVLLDEPFSQIMPLHVETLQRLIREESRRKGILITDHMYRHVEAVADRIYLMSDGTTRPVGSHEELVHLGYLPHL